MEPKKSFIQQMQTGEPDEMRKCYDCNKYFKRSTMTQIEVKKVIVGESIRLVRFLCAECSKKD